MVPHAALVAGEEGVGRDCLEVIAQQRSSELVVVLDGSVDGSFLARQGSGGVKILTFCYGGSLHAQRRMQVRSKSSRRKSETSPPSLSEDEPDR